MMAANPLSQLLPPPINRSSYNPPGDPNRGKQTGAQNGPVGPYTYDPPNTTITPVSRENHIGFNPGLPSTGVGLFPRPPGWIGPWPYPGSSFPLPGQPTAGQPTTGTPTTPPTPGTPQQPVIPPMYNTTPTTGTPQTPGTPSTPTGPAPGASNNLGGILSQIPPLHLPTQQSQNQLMALAAQQANPVQSLNRMGNNGIQTGSAINVQKLLGPMMQTMQQGALGAANLGIDDQLLRDKHLLQGVVGLGGLENDRLRAAAGRQRIGLDANEQLLNALLSMLGGLGNTFNIGNLTGGFGDIAGAF